MRKISILAASALTLVGTLGMPVIAQAAPCSQGQVKVIVGNATANTNNNSCNTQGVKEQLAQYGINLDEILKNNCNNSINCLPKGDCNTNNDCESNQDCDTSTPATPAKEEAPAVTPPPASEEQKTELSFQEQVVKLVNEERAKAGLSALTLDTTVQSAAQVRAQESATSFSHTRPDGTSFSTALTEAGVKYKGSGENIAWGQKNPEEVMKGWMNSAGHKANILNPNYTKIGVGYYQNAKGVNYWSQLFIY